MRLLNSMRPTGVGGRAFEKPPVETRAGRHPPLLTDCPAAYLHAVALLDRRLARGGIFELDKGETFARAVH